MSGHDMDRRREARISELRKAILDYVREHPNASDTARGIVTWWLPDVWMHEGTDLIDDALRELSQAGALHCVWLPDGGLLYSAKQVGDRDADT